MNKLRCQTVCCKGLSARYLVLLSLLIIGIFTGCAGKDRGIEAGKDKGPFSWFRSVAGPSKPESEVDLSEEAMDYFIRGRYILAEEIFQKVKDRYPFSPYATLAELRLADCKFYRGNYDEAIPLYEEFEKLHPTNEAVTYVIFQEGSCYYGLMENPDRDQTSTHKLIKTYERLLNRYPDSPYSYETRKRIAEAKNRLARHEILVARWYIRTGQVPQAKNRLETAMDLYPDTSAGVKAARILKKERIFQDVSATGTDRVKESEKSWWRRLIPFI
jgi:outer membrane protein assembly factor BamD